MHDEWLKLKARNWSLFIKTALFPAVNWGGSLNLEESKGLETNF